MVAVVVGRVHAPAIASTIDRALADGAVLQTKLAVLIASIVCHLGPNPAPPIMIRKLIIRLLLAGVAVVALIVAAVAIVGFLALQEPSFYAQAEPASPEVQQAAREQLEREAESIDRWRRKSLELQQSQPTGVLAALAAAVGQDAYDPTEDVHVVRITERRLNALLVAEEIDISGALESPRIRILQDRIELGARLDATTFECVLSVGLEPSLTAGGGLRLDIVSARVGKVALPLNALLSYLPGDLNRADQDLEINLTPPSPHVLFKSIARGGESITVRSITCAEGEVVVELLPPILAPVAPRAPAKLADSAGA